MIFNRYISLLTRYIIKELLIKNNITLRGLDSLPRFALVARRPEVLSE
jgi:hypothetical protein